MSYSHLLTTTTITLLSTEDVLSEIGGAIVMAVLVGMSDAEFQRLKVAPSRKTDVLLLTVLNDCFS
jgi:hypothetical protein